MKNLKKVFLYVFVSAVICAVSSAQTVNIKSICADLSSNPVTRGDFTQLKSMTTAKGKRELKSTGKFLFSLQGIVWNTEKPFPTSMIIMPSKIKTTSANGQVNVIDGKDNPAFSNIATSLTAVFSGDLAKLEENFKVTFTADASDNWTISLVPSDPSLSKAITKILLSGNKVSGKSQLNGIELTEASQNTIKYIFENQSYSKELTANEKAYFAE